MNLKRAFVLVLACAGFLTSALASPAVAAGAVAPDDVCGIPPGDGTFNQIQVWNMRCKHGRQVSRKAGHELCGRRFEKCDAPDGEFDSGTVQFNGWTCKVRVGYESYRARCTKGEKRFLHRAGA